ncbi:MAG TPA: glycosyltransferase family 39 protein [Xanthobacteraceae bacterium]|nr:glycosyltransferase family 39 protein [Xanthobacteraceae bacterium]
MFTRAEPMHLPSPPAGPSARLFDRLSLLVLLLTACVALATFRHYGLGWDDYTHAQMGEKLLALYNSGFSNKDAFSFVNLYMYGGAFDMLAALAAKILPFELFETRRLTGAAVGLVGLFTTWRIGRRVGGPLAGFLALLLLASCPVFYGHAFINAKDVPFAVASAILLLGLVRIFEEYPRPAFASVMLFGCGLGLTLGTRIMGVMIGVWAAAALVFMFTSEATTRGRRPALARLGRFFVVLLPGFILGYAVMGLVWPWAVMAPLNPLRALEYFLVFFEKPWREVFAGQLISVPDMPARYLPTLLALKLPEIMIALALGGVVLAGARLANKALPVQQRSVQLLLLAAALGPMLIVITTRPAMYNGFRHFLFLLPPLAVLGGLAGAWLMERAAGLGRTAAAAASAAIAIAIASPVVEMVRLHPYEYTHFNRLQGGVRGAHNRYMLDYWGLSFKQAAEELRALVAERLGPPPDGRRWKVAVCGPHPPAAVELGPEFELTWDPSGADFALMLGAYYCMQFGAPILTEVVRDGVVYARAYDIRQRSFSTLFTTPPP